jgi:CheY-like chemotaxis protein
MRLEFESNVSTVPFVENGLAENVAENNSAQSSELLREGIKAAQAGNRAEARHLLLRVTETEPHNENAWLWLASISEYPEELLIFLNNVLNVNPENARAKEWMKQTKSLLAKTFVQRGIDASNEGQNDFAKQCFYQAAAQDDSNEMAWLWLASVSDKAEEKVVHLNKSLQINPDNEDAKTALKAVHQELAKTLLQNAVAAANTGDRQSASELLKEVLLKSPEMEEAWMLKAELADDSSEKIRYYEKVLEFNSENEKAHAELRNIHHNLAQALLRNAKTAAFAGDSNSANEMLAEVLEKSPELEEAWMLKSHLALGFDEKMLCFEKVLEINPSNEAAQSGLNTLRAFMPQIADGKDEYAQMAEEFAEEFAEEEFFTEEFQPESANHFEEKSLEEVSPTEAEHQFAPATELAEVQAAPEFVQETAAEPELFHSFTEEAKEVQEIEFFQPAEATSAFQSESESVFELAVEETPDETQAHDDEIVEAKFEEFKVAPFEQVQAEAAPEEIYSETFETHYTEQAQEFAPQAETESPEQVETVEHQPTQLFEKPAGELDYEQYEFQLSPEINSAHNEFPQNSDSPESNLVEAAPIQEPSPEVIEEKPHFSHETAPVNFEQISFADTAEAREEFAPEATFAEENLSTSAENLSPNSEELQAQMPEVQEEVKELVHEEVQEQYEASAAQSFPETQEPVARQQPQDFPCPFCNVENDAQAFACSSCRVVLSLSDMEMLLANQNADKEVLQQTVNRMEVEKSNGNFGEYELMFLGIGHINLKNLRQGFSYLQQASLLNPNNVLLTSQINALAIRIEEIERQEEVHDSMPKGRTILVVDDSPTVRKLISSKLEKSGHEVLCAVDGMDALAKLGEVLPDLILLDITMPRMDGYQVCKLIRNSPETKDIPIVMISGKDGFFDKVRGRMAGTTGYITKPFGPETLMKALDIYIKPSYEVNLDNSITPER